jgi:hypothetical protein
MKYFLAAYIIVASGFLAFTMPKDTKTFNPQVNSTNKKVYPNPAKGSGAWFVEATLPQQIVP